MPDEQSSLFGDDGLGTSRHKRVLNQQQTQPVTDAPAKPQYDPNQLALLVNPTEHIARMKKSTDIGVLYRRQSYPITREDIDKVGAPTEDMRTIGAIKEYEAKQPVESGHHGAGVADIFVRREAIRSPIEVNMHSDDPDEDIQFQGHHRAFAGAAYERDTGQQGAIWMPVQYNDKRPKPPPPEKDYRGRRLARYADPQHTDVAEGAEQVYGGPARRVGTSEGYRFAAHVDHARAIVHARQASFNRNPDPKRGDATNRQNAIAAAVRHGQGIGESIPPGIGTAVDEVVAGRRKARDKPLDDAIRGLVGVLGSPRPVGNRYPDYVQPGTTTRGAQVDSLARRQQKHQAIKRRPLSEM